jgi:lysyl-tRNA synthetase class 2
MDEQSEQRIQKLDTLRAGGIDPYGSRFHGKSPLAEIRLKYADAMPETVASLPVDFKIAGRMVSLRRFGKAAFAHLQDASGSLQVYFKKDILGADFALFEQLDLGDHVGVEGPLFFTKSHELTLQARRLTLLAKSLHPLPEKWHGLTDVETRYRMRYVDLIANPDVKQVFVQRSRILASLRRMLTERGFLEVETPMMHPIAGGAAARPFVTHHHTLDVDLYLRIAPELYLKRLIVGGFERVFEINRSFRNEGISTIHNPEFTMLEFYMAYADYQDLMTLTEEILCAVAQEAVGHLKIVYQNRPIDLSPPWRRLNYLESIAERHGVPLSSLSDLAQVSALAEKLGRPQKEGTPLHQIVNDIFEETVEPGLIDPTFICDYPTAISPLAKRQADRPEWTERFELYIAGREIANAFSELNDPFDQRSRFEAQVAQRAAGDVEAHQMDEDYLRALEYGMPPTGGCGIGIDRLVMLLTDQASIRDVILFPQMKPLPNS